MSDATSCVICVKIQQDREEGALDLELEILVVVVIILIIIINDNDDNNVTT